MGKQAKQAKHQDDKDSTEMKLQYEYMIENKILTRTLIVRIVLMEEVVP